MVKLEGEPMEIHKPKPVHDWRELLSELGVVVIGILIALSAEQVVEALHRDHQRHELRESLAHDGRQIVRDGARSAAFSKELIRWLTGELARIKTARTLHKPIEPADSATLTTYDVPYDPTFAAANSSGALNLLPHDEAMAHAEAHFASEQTRKAYEAMMACRQEVLILLYKFRGADGDLDLSKATDAELAELSNKMTATAFAADLFRYWSETFAITEATILKGEYRLSALQDAEDTITGRSPSLQMKWFGLMGAAKPAS